MTISASDIAANIEQIVAAGLQFAIAPAATLQSELSALATIGATNMAIVPGGCIELTYLGNRYRLTMIQGTPTGIYPGSSQLSSCVYYSTAAAVLTTAAQPGYYTQYTVSVI